MGYAVEFFSDDPGDLIHGSSSSRADPISPLILGPLLRTSEVQSVFRLTASNTL